jgi:aminoglycoside 6'-N-acetyltransferase I
MNIRCTTQPDDPDWLLLRSEFFPEDFAGEHQQFLQGLAATGRFTAFIAMDENGKAEGFAEVSIRHDYVNGCKYRPALFLEGIYVRPEFRGQGLARALCAAAAQFGEQNGCQEFASDVLMDDHDSLAAHARLGFAETERVVYFRRFLSPLDSGGQELK